MVNSRVRILQARCASECVYGFYKTWTHSIDTASTRIRSLALQILNALPTAFIGGVIGLVLTGQTLTVASLVGFISLGGIAVRNGILLVTHYFHLMEKEGEHFRWTVD